jgi:hypothetical protein
MNESKSWNSGESPSLTCGDYQDEIASGKQFDECIQKSGLFKIWGKGSSKGITGEMIQRLPSVKYNDHYYIDRILEPTPKMQDAGWDKGLIGVELKKSHVKVGPPLSQMLDYLRCVWNGPGNIKVLIDYCFLWPLEKCGGATASIMAQNHIGGVCLQYPPEKEYHRLVFHIGEQYVIQYKPGSDKVEVRNLNIGNRTGSR